jgi:hypothetical protein
MSQDFHRDAAFLRGFLGRGVPYLGVLGPRDRTDRLLAELRAQPGEAELAALHAPTPRESTSPTPAAPSSPGPSAATVPPTELAEGASLEVGGESPTALTDWRDGFVALVSTVAWTSPNETTWTSSEIDGIDGDVSQLLIGTSRPSARALHLVAA